MSTANIEKMFEMAKAARENAYAPYSKFHVGAVVQAEDGELFAGCNIENASYGLTQCSERAAITNMVTAGRKRALALLVIGDVPDFITPCGACRQWLREFMDQDAPIYLCNIKGVQKTTNIAELLPHSFGPEDLR